jgi:hypothetical protein
MEQGFIKIAHRTSNIAHRTSKIAHRKSESRLAIHDSTHIILLNNITDMTASKETYKSEISRKRGQRRPEPAKALAWAGKLPM